jgi:hypothetical protein
MSKRPLITGVAATLILFGTLASIGSSTEHAEINEITRCHENMLIIAAAEEQYYELYGRYTVVYSDLESVSPGISELHCAEDLEQSQYGLAITTPPCPTYCITCPVLAFLHGSIEDGVQSWD